MCLRAGASLAMYEANRGLSTKADLEAKFCLQVGCWNGCVRPNSVFIKTLQAEPAVRSAPPDMLSMRNA